MQQGSTPLYRASFAGNIEEIEALLEAGADVNEKNDVSLTFHLLFVARLRILTCDVMCPL